MTVGHYWSAFAAGSKNVPFLRRKFREWWRKKMSATSRRNKRKRIEHLKKKRCSLCPLSALCLSGVIEVKACSVCGRRFVQGKGEWELLPRPYDTICPHPESTFVCENAQCQVIAKTRREIKLRAERESEERRHEKKREERKASGEKGEWRGIHRQPRVPKKLWGNK